MKGDLVVVGMSHRTAPVELRERLSVTMRDVGPELRQALESEPLHEAVLISTCNRVELYAACDDPVTGAAAAQAFLERRATQPLDGLVYKRTGAEAARHVFRVASSLDSLVVGEPQILGQVKDAYEAASGAGAVGGLLSRCFSRAFAVAKRVRTETGIAEGTVSVSSIACELATKIFGDLRNRRCLLIGAGEMGEAAARSLAQTGAQLIVINRSLERAQVLAERCAGEARPYDSLSAELIKADVVITSTSSAQFVLTEELLRDVMRARKQRPLFLIDIAVPRDIDPRVASLNGIFLYDVDDLQRVADENLASRRQHLAAADGIVETELNDFEAWRRTLDLTPTIVALRQRFSDTLRAELERGLGRGDFDPAALDRTVQAAVNKLLHHPVTAMKAGTLDPDGPLLIATTRRLFRLDDEPPAASAETTKGEPTTLSLAAAGGRRERP